MKQIGALIVCFSLGMRIEQYLSVNHFLFDYAFVLSMIGMVLIIIDQFTESKGIPKMGNPPPPPKKCICNNVDKHSPGGRCDAVHFAKKDGGSTFKI